MRDPDEYYKINGVLNLDHLGCISFGNILGQTDTAIGDLSYKINVGLIQLPTLDVQRL